MKVLLLVAGQSNRFWPLYEKPLFTVCGKSIFARQLEGIRQAGFTDIHIVGSQANIRELLALEPTLEYSIQSSEQTGMWGAMMSALPNIPDQPLFILSSNDIFDCSVLSTVKNAVDQGKGGALLAKQVEEYFPGGYLKTSGQTITGIIEKPGAGHEPSDLVNLVAHAHSSSQDLLTALMQVDNNNDDGYEQALSILFTQKEFIAVPYTTDWFAIKYPWHLLPILEASLGKITKPWVSPEATIHETAVITGPVIIEAGAKVYAHSSIVGPCYIGKNATVANNALVRNASIGDRSVVGYSTEVKHSVLGSDVWTHMSYIGDSIIGNNVSFGAGAVTGNLRLDEAEITSTIKDQPTPTGLTKFGTVIGDNCRLGIHVSLAPGVKIGSGSFVSSATYVTQDLPNKSFARMKDGTLKVTENHTEVALPEHRDAFRKKI